MTVADVVAVLVGLLIVQAVLRSAVRTVVVPRGERVLLPRVVFLSVRRAYQLAARRRDDDAHHHAVFARFAPMSLVTLAATWVFLVFVGFIPIMWGLTDLSWKEAMLESGSSITTLGAFPPPTTAAALAAFAEAIIGLGLLALLISYLPTIYGHFARREASVQRLEVRAGGPPSAGEFLRRYHSIGWHDRLDDEFGQWEQWFAELEESHTSQPSLVLFRSQHQDCAWITAAGAVLDTGALTLAVIDRPFSPNAALMLRGGFLSLRAIADFYDVPFDPDPAPNDPIWVSRAEFDTVVDGLAAAGLPVRADRDQAWRDFAGWRVNYELVLLALCRLSAAPPAPWSADRVAGFAAPTLLRPHRWVIPPCPNGASW